MQPENCKEVGKTHREVKMAISKTEFTQNLLAQGNLSESFVEALLPQIDSIFTEIPEEKRPALLDLVVELVEHQRENEIALRPFINQRALHRQGESSRRQRPVVGSETGADGDKESVVDKAKKAV